jgi:hypothetical protein
MGEGSAEPVAEETLEHLPIAHWYELRRME